MKQGSEFDGLESISDVRRAAPEFKKLIEAESRVILRLLKKQRKEERSREKGDSPLEVTEQPLEQEKNMLLSNLSSMIAWLQTLQTNSQSISPLDLSESNSSARKLSSENDDQTDHSEILPPFPTGYTLLNLPQPSKRRRTFIAFS